MTNVEFRLGFNEFSDKNFYQYSDSGVHLEQGFAEPVFTAEIIMGDWKHEHWRMDYLVGEYCRIKGLQLLRTNEELIFEDGSDSYSSLHTYLIGGLD